jgi:phosphoribosylamine--glycine ligase
VTADIHQRVMREVIYPTVKGMATEGNTYVGFLYAGLMIMADGTPKVIEYNCRFGDPETQPIMLRLQSDLIGLVEAALDGKLDQIQAEFDSRASVGVVIAAGGYPANYGKGDVIDGLELGNANSKIFHAGTKNIDGKVITNGGRVLCATALGNTVTEAQQNAYKLAKTISWNGMFYRDDIAYRAIAREQKK